MTTYDKTPYALGYRMPAEWERHAAVWLAWPHDPVTFPHLDQAEAALADFVSEIHPSERVELLVRDAPMQRKATQLLQTRAADLSRINFHSTDYADIWFRDYGPIFIVHRDAGHLAMTKWIFNAWGNKYEELLKDTRIPYFMNESLRLPLFEPGFVLEGGSIDVNGRGTLLTTEQCLLNKNRNPGLCKEDIESYLHDYLGATHCIWLKEGIAGDDTDGHIDDIARFVSPTTVVCASQPDRSDPDHEVLEANYQFLRRATDQDERPLHVVPLPVPGWVGDEQGRLPASYANFYIGNTKVLVPTFGVENDARALEILQSLFPDRQVVGINAVGLVYGLGTFHCMSQQQPAARL
jgi:agmatine deiminase